jgi:hypothetical protein
MGGILVAPRDFAPFAVDGQQWAYLVERKLLAMPEIPTDEIRAVNKADGLARLVTLVQMIWFCIACIGQGAVGLEFSTLEVTTHAFIYCTLHTFFFWYHKPLDVETQSILPANVELKDLCQHSDSGTPGCPTTYTFTPLDFVKSPPDLKSLTAPFGSASLLYWATAQLLRKNRRGHCHSPRDSSVWRQFGPDIVSALAPGGLLRLPKQKVEDGKGVLQKKRKAVHDNTAVEMTQNNTICPSKSRKGNRKGHGPGS